MSIDQQKLFKKRASTNALDVYASGPVNFWGRTHELALGLNGYRENTVYSGSGWTASTPINVYTFNPNTLVDPAIGSGFSGGAKISQLGIYGVGRFSLTDSLKLIAGTRVSNYENKDPVTDTTNQKESGVISPYAGLIYDINKQYSAYISYSDIFTPQSYKAADGGTLKPVVGANYEAGIKGEIFEKRLNVSAAVFQLMQSNLAKVDTSTGPTACSGNPCYVAQDKVRSEGIELGANGEIVPGWHLAAGYTYVSSKYASGTNDGQRYMTNLPQHNLRLATSYKLPHTAWTLGGSLAAYSKAYLSDVSWISGDPWTIRQGAFALVGLNAKYKIDPKTELTFAVNNLFDRTYRTYLVTRDYSVYGDPRNLTVNLRYRF